MNLPTPRDVNRWILAAVAWLAFSLQPVLIPLHLAHHPHFHGETAIGAWSIAPASSADGDAPSGTDAPHGHGHAHSDHPHGHAPASDPDGSTPHDADDHPSTSTSATAPDATHDDLPPLASPLLPNVVAGRGTSTARTIDETLHPRPPPGALRPAAPRAPPFLL